MSIKEIDPIDAAIGKKLRTFRLMHSVSQQKLGEAMNVTFQQIQKYEAGLNKLSVKAIIRISKHYRVSPMIFFEQDMLEQFNLIKGSDAEKIVKIYTGIKSTLLRNAAMVMMTAIFELSENKKGKKDD